MMIGTLVTSNETYADLKDGLVSVWKFDEGKGDVAHDSIGNNDGIIDGAEWANGKFGMALDFDGTDDGVEISDDPSLQLADALTVAAWIYPRATKNAAGLDHAGICWKGNMIGWGSDVYNWRIATADDAGLTWGACGSGTEGYFATGNCFVDGLNTWYHVALVEDGSEGRAYVNGVVQTDADVTGGDMHGPRAPYDVWEGEPVRIGWSQGHGGDLNALVYFNGIIDEVVIYNRALSEDEIEELMEKGAPGGRITPQPERPEEPGVPSGSSAATWGTIKNSTLVYIEEQVVDVNTTFHADVRVSRAKNMAGFQISLDYDPYSLRFVEAQEGQVLSRDGATSFWRNPDVDAEAGTIVRAASTRTEAGGVDVEDDVLMTLTFETKELGRTMIWLQDVKLSDPESQLIPLLVTSAFITISPPWDVVTDSVIDIRDMVAVAQNLAVPLAAPVGMDSMPDADKYNPDVDRNGVVDVDDLIIVSDHLGESYKEANATEKLSPIAELRRAYYLINAAPGSSHDIERFKAHLMRLITMERAKSPPVISQLLSNYPNPFNPDTKITFSLPEASKVTVAVYNILGQVVDVLVDQEIGPGHHSVTWNAGELSSGIYFYRIVAGNFTETKRIVLLK